MGLVMSDQIDSPLLRMSKFFLVVPNDGYSVYKAPGKVMSRVCPPDGCTVGVIVPALHWIDKNFLGVEGQIVYVDSSGPEIIFPDNADSAKATIFKGCSSRVVASIFGDIVCWKK